MCIWTDWGFWIAILALGVSGYIAFLSNRTAKMQAYSFVTDTLQKEDIRQARRTLFRLGEENKKFETWSQLETEEVEKACHTINTVCTLIEEKIIRKTFLKRSETQFKRIWNIVEPYVIERRKKENNPSLWQEFENFQKDK
ncbi:MAG TPA: DUF4760 domain-containing protein [Dehalococcoidia bacterium]|nr:DUF4760 domain-containing protein [Dehalococcoidia bacterium]